MALPLKIGATKRQPILVEDCRADVAAHVEKLEVLRELVETHVDAVNAALKNLSLAVEAVDLAQLAALDPLAAAHMRATWEALGDLVDGQLRIGRNGGTASRAQLYRRRKA